MKPLPYNQAIANRRRLIDVLPLAMPLVVHLDSTSACNFRCTFCPQSLSDGRHHVAKPVAMEFSLYEKIIDELCGWGKLNALRFGMFGEPFMNPQFPDMLQLALERNAAGRIVIFTNGALLDETKAERLCSLAANVDTIIYVRFSIVSVLPDKHRRLSGSNVDIDRIRDNIAFLKSLRERAGADNLGLCAKMIDSKSDENEIFLERYRDLVDDLELDAPGNWTGIVETDFIANIYDGPVEKRKFPHRKSCSFPFYYLGVHSDGTVTACTDDWCRCAAIGNVRTQTLPEIWNGDPLRKLRLLHLGGKRNEIDICRNCGQIDKNPDSDDIDSLTADDWHSLTEKKL